MLASLVLQVISYQTGNVSNVINHVLIAKTMPLSVLIVYTVPNLIKKQELVLQFAKTMNFMKEMKNVTLAKVLALLVFIMTIIAQLVFLGIPYSQTHVLLIRNLYVTVHAILAQNTMILTVVLLAKIIKFLFLENVTIVIAVV